MENPANLKQIANVLAEDIKTLSSLSLKVVVGAPKNGDLYLQLGTVKNQTTDEAYTMKIGSSSIVVSGETSRGIYYGTRSLLQIMIQSNDKRSLPVGDIEDWPNYQIRGFFLDDARKFFPVSFLQDYARFMGWFKLNTFHVHLNDNDFLTNATASTWKTKYAGFRLKTTNPKLSGLARGENQWYTKQQFQAIQNVVKANSMILLPEFDSPAHALAFGQFKPEIGSYPVLDNSYLNLNKTETYDFMKSVRDEFAPWFDSKTLHIGADEYPSSQAAQFRDYVNTMSRYVWEKHGKKPQVWGTGIEFDKNQTLSIDTNITISHWANWEDNPENLTNLGYKTINVNDGGPVSSYIVPKSGGGGDKIDSVQYLAKYSPPIFGTGYNLETEQQLSNLLGGMFAVWFDNLGPSTTRWETHSIVGDTMATIAEILWNGSQNGTDPNIFFSNVKTVTQGPINLKLEIPSKTDTMLNYTFDGARGNTLKDASGNGYDAKISGAKWTGTKSTQALAFNRHSSVAVKLGTKGFNSTLFMTLNISSTQPSTLLSSAEGQLKISQTEISISNDNYTYSIQFNTTLSGSSDIAITSAAYPVGSKRYINGKYLANFTYFIPAKSLTVPMGLVTPLDYIGSGFSGTLSAFQIYNRILSLDEIAQLSTKVYSYK
ncbi:glycoside hydrolase superfamily [Umbelopsis sp. PMI_123]|nr:glycoside hydrolase superfamily [Umbelopsis sp. PMI_123]